MKVRGRLPDPTFLSLAKGLCMTARVTRLSAAVLLVVGGLIHYDRWSAGYRHIPGIGPLFMANCVMSIAIAATLVVTRRATAATAGIVLAAGSLVALVLSRTTGLLGFTETTWTPQAINTLLSEVAAILTLGVVLGLQLRARHHRPAVNTVSHA